MLTIPYAALVLIVLISAAFGYGLGRLDWLVSRTSVCAEPVGVPGGNTLRTVMQDSAREKTKISIDTGKYVGDINTDTLQKTQQLELGKTTQTQDDISSSVSKLAQLKGK